MGRGDTTLDPSGSSGVVSCAFRASARLAVIALLLLAAGCQTTYVRSRTADLLDSVPVSLSYGWGLGISARATPLFHLGLAASPIVSTRLGYEDRLFHGRWNEYQASFPWVFWADSVGQLTPPPHDASGFIERGGVPLVYRWQIMRRAPLGEGERDHFWEPNDKSFGRHPPIVREIRGAFIIPEQRHLLEFEDVRLGQGDEDVLVSIGSPDRATLWQTERYGRPTPAAWDLFELDGMLLVFGLRVGVRPVEFVDFLVGFTTLDLLGDDLPDPLVWEPASQAP